MKPTHGIDYKQDDLWSLALEERNRIAEAKDGNSKLLGSDNAETHILFVGAQNSGKTSIILRFLERDEPPKPTTALEYTFGRRSRGANIAKDVTHVWELGGGTFLSTLLQVPITVDNISFMSIVLMVDLSKPEEIWVTLEVFIKQVRMHVRSLLTELKSQRPDLVNELAAISWKHFGDDHPDKELLDPCLIPLAIVGTKYDIFQDFDPEKKKVISKTLRFIAHTNGASLQYYSNKSDSLMLKTKQLLSKMAFGTDMSPTVCVEHTKPLLVPVGSDALAQIGVPSLSISELGKMNARNPLDLWKQTFCAFFPQVSVKSELADDPCKDTKYKEEAVDTMRLQKDCDLDRYRRECERKVK